VPIDLGTQPLTDLILTLLVIHITIGVPLAYAWRRSGNLALPAAVHALVDSVRDGLFAVV
jgi:membrane protease YdiL (CAAX protease family)